MANFGELLKQAEPLLVKIANEPKGGWPVKELLVRLAQAAEPPPSAEEFKKAMQRYGLKPGYD